MPVLHFLWEILTPAAIDELRNVVANNQLFREAGLGAGIDDDRRGVGEMMAHDFGFSSIDVSRRFKARPG